MNIWSRFEFSIFETLHENRCLLYFNVFSSILIIPDRILKFWKNKKNKLLNDYDDEDVHIHGNDDNDEDFDEDGAPWWWWSPWWWSWFHGDCDGDNHDDNWHDDDHDDEGHDNDDGDDNDDDDADADDGAQLSDNEIQMHWRLEIASNKRFRVSLGTLL